jgi:hypothetical protein
MSRDTNAALSKARLFARLAQGLAGGVTVVTPNRRLAQALSREFDAARAAHGRSAWESADILPYSAFVQRCYEDALYSELYMDVRGGAGCAMDRHADKLARDAIIWSHLAGDTVQRLKVAGRLPR